MQEVRTLPPQERNAFFLHHLFPLRGILIEYCRDLGASETEAADAADAALCCALEKLDQLKDPDRAAAWLFAITGNMLRQVVRRRARGVPSGYLSETVPGADEALLREEQMRRLYLLMRKLPHPQRQTLYAHAFLGLRPAELAAALGVSPRVVHARLYRARRTMRKQWTAQQQPVSVDPFKSGLK